MSGHSWHLTETYRGLISRALRMDDWPRAYFPLQSFSENEVPERVPLLESMAPQRKQVWNGKIIRRHEGFCLHEYIFGFPADFSRGGD
jgi:hypothetical protein